METEKLFFVVKEVYGNTYYRSFDKAYQYYKECMEEYFIDNYIKEDDIEYEETNFVTKEKAEELLKTNNSLRIRSAYGDIKLFSMEFSD